MVTRTETLRNTSAALDSVGRGADSLSEQASRGRGQAEALKGQAKEALQRG